MTAIFFKYSRVRPAAYAAIAADKAACAVFALPVALRGAGGGAARVRVKHFGTDFWK